MAYYIDTNDFTTATAVWTNSILTTKSTDGYYSFGGNYRQQIDGFLTDLISCSNIDTVSITAIEETTATFNGNLISNGGDISATRGFVYGTSPNPTTANNVLTDTAVGQGLYSLNATGLTSETVYYVKAYAIVFGSTIYGDELNFETQTVICFDCIPGTEVTIGTQLWTGCNLDVTTYRDGTPIPQVTDPTAWAGLTTGAWCYYDNDFANGPTYGKLYNWYAVNDIDHDGLAPIGYHVPTDAEWTVLTDYLGGVTVAGGEMKEAGLCHWLTPNTDATDSSGFTGLPGGGRYPNGTFSAITYTGFWWSSTENDTTNAFYRNLNHNNGDVYGYYNFKSYGFSVRLIKDEEPTLKEFLISNLSDPTDACGLLLPNTVYVSNTNTIGADTTATNTSIVYTNLAGTITFIGDGNYYALFCNDLSNTVTTNQIITSGGTITGLIGICPS